MANSYGIPPGVENQIRERDTTCVYCGVKMKPFSRSKGSRSSMATIEHLHNGEPWDELWNLAICCWACNGSKGVKPLSEWFETEYCRKKKISKATVARVVREFMSRKPRLA